MIKPLKKQVILHKTKRKRNQLRKLLLSLQALTPEVGFLLCRKMLLKNKR
jgi:hypothetical protein